MFTMAESIDWQQRYVQKQTPWDTGFESPQLGRIIEERGIKPGRALEIGCGTGTNAVALAQRGFDVTAFDLSPLAIDQAREKAAKAGVKVNFFQANAMELPDLGRFGFVFDRGVYHVLRRVNLFGFLKLLDRVAEPGGWYFTEAGNANDPVTLQEGPPRVTQVEMAGELAMLFNLVELKEFQFEGIMIDGKQMKPLAWAGLYRRK
jgi:2-polyprenyl-3-methyl-5-hydroxy-6-metoxy-1,4-benzoquinol methylase